LLTFHAGKGTIERDAGIVDNESEGITSYVEACEGVAHGISITDVEGAKLDVPTRRADLARNPLGCAVIAEVIHHDAVSIPSQCSRHRGANPATGTSHESTTWSGWSKDVRHEPSHIKETYPFATEVRSFRMH
jgi:hypothetical protein